MKLINYITDLTLGYKTTKQKFDEWNVRQAARAVLLNDKNQIALMHIAKYNVYKLPGGGVDEDERLDLAFLREILEETGCEVEKTGEIGITIEKRNQWKMFQVSYCYLAKVLKVKSSELTDEEKGSGFSLHWVSSIEEAIELVNKNKSDRYDDKYIKERANSILQKAKELLNRK